MKYIFLGDLYDYAKPKESISQISQILNALNVDINYPFTNESKEIDIIRAYRKLWKLKQLKSYSKFNIQYLHSKPKPVDIQTENYLFILGNKEVIFIQEIITSEKITKKDNVFIVPADYKRKHKKPGESDVKHTDYNFTVEELNIMYNYLSLCYNYVIIDNTLFIHCYINYKLFMNDNLKIKRIISGHSKGYGHFIDSDFKDVEIYILDLTGIDDYVNNYMILTNSTIQHTFNDNFKPVLEKLTWSPNIDQTIVKLSNIHPLANKQSTDDYDYITEHCKEEFTTTSSSNSD